MNKHLIKTVWGVLLASALLAAAAGLAARFRLALFLALVVLAAWAYLTLRVWMFRSKLTQFIRRLLVGNYDTGVRVSAAGNDEVVRLEELLNKLGEQLNAYDVLRADRVAQSYHALDLIFSGVSEGLAIADIGKRTLQLNPAMQAVFGVEQGNFGLETVMKLPANAALAALFNRVVDKDKVAVEGEASLQLPVRDLRRDVRVRLVPLKGRDEQVKLVFVFFGSRPAAPGSKAGRPGQRVV